jgi:hypothetical protein
MKLLAAGGLAMLKVENVRPISYSMPIGDSLVPLNDLLGERIKLTALGVIYCIHCGRKTNKSFSQGYCYPCMKKLACCDICIVSPEKCHYHEGTCREPEWGEQYCMSRHYVYLANSSGVKVGITREENMPKRWIDQGAVQALPIFAVATRYLSGLLETLLKQYVADKTNWRTMLKGGNPLLDLETKRDELLTACREDIQALQERFGLQAIQYCSDADVLAFDYPVLEYPTKVVSHNLDKNPDFEGQLLGIKGQYLILDTGVINIRKYTGYQVELHF